jgi:tetratricopeptide (TPR) repeat protein
MAECRQRKIFVSATTRGLGSFRRALVGVLQAKGYEVVVQESLKLDYRDVPRMLRAAISPCDVVLCLVGRAFGAEPENRPEGAPRRSYTQLEYDMGTALRKPVFVFLAAPDCPLDAYQEEEAELRELQGAFRNQLQQRRLAEHAQRQLSYEFSSCNALLAVIGDPRRFPDAADVPDWTAKPCNLRQVSLGELFKGREDFIATLRAAALARPESAALVVARQAIHGLGGVGKTRLAIEYAWRFAAEYTSLLSVSANTHSDLHRNLAALVKADVLDLPEQAAVEEAVQVAAVLRWLRTNPGWLLIVDNVDTPEGAAAVEDLLPQLAHGHVLVTTRISQWGVGLQTLELTVLDEQPAQEFLPTRTAGKRKPQADDEATAAELARDLDGLALALEQAGAYVAYHRCSLAEYRGAWREQDALLREWFDERLMKYPRSLAATWETTVAQLPAEARALLRLLAYLAPEPIPAGLLRTDAAGEILTEAAAALPSHVGESLRDLQSRLGGTWQRAACPSAALAKLAEYSLIRWETDGGDEAAGDEEDADAFSMHRVVQEVTRERTPQEERRDWIDRALRLVNGYADGDLNDVRTWPLWDAIRPHATAIVLRADRAGIARPTSRLMNDLGLLLHCKCTWQEAERLYRRAVEIDEQSYGPDNPTVAIGLNNLALLLKGTNRLAEAEPLMRRALAIDEQSYGPKHPSVAIDLNNLAGLLQDTNRLAEAEPLMRRALAIDEQSYGPDHPNVAIRLNNLALLLKDTNRLAEAEPLMRRALEIDEQSYGPDLPQVAIDLNNLAGLFWATNRLAEAELLMRRALAIDEQSYGPDHPEVATDLNNLAGLLQDTNRLAEAEPLMRRALAIDEQSYGPDHPDVAIRLNNLALLLQDTNRLAEAEPLMRRQVIIFRKFGETTGHEHPHMQAAIENYRQLLAAMGLTDAEVDARLREPLYRPA